MALWVLKFPSLRESGVNSSFKTNVLPVLIGLAIAGGLIALKVTSRQERERAYQQRLAQDAKRLEAQNKKPFITESPAQKQERKEAEQAMLAFMDEVLADHFAEAYLMTTPAFRAKFTQAAFEDLVRANPDIRAPDKCIIFINAALSNGTLTSMQLRKSPADNTATIVVNVTAVKQDRWRVNDFTIEPRTKP